MYSVTRVKAVTCSLTKTKRFNGNTNSDELRAGQQQWKGSMLRQLRAGGGGDIERLAPESHLGRFFRQDWTGISLPAFTIVLFEESKWDTTMAWSFLPALVMPIFCGSRVRGLLRCHLDARVDIFAGSHDLKGEKRPSEFRLLALTQVDARRRHWKTPHGDLIKGGLIKTEKQEVSCVFFKETWQIEVQIKRWPVTHCSIRM